MVLTAAIALNPLGIDVIRTAFLSSESLSRDIWRPIALAGMAIATVIVLLDWGIRKPIISRRARGTTISS